MDNIAIINTGGTFNKRYNPINGELEVPLDNKSIENILKKVLLINKKPKVKGIIFKDSLQMDKNDRELLLNTIRRIKEPKIIIVHGTDTIDKSAKLIAKNIKDKQIVFTGAMVPASIDTTEATGNLMQAIGFAKGNKKDGVYIAMNGNVEQFDKIKKNRKLGAFQCQ